MCLSGSPFCGHALSFLLGNMCAWAWSPVDMRSFLLGTCALWAWSLSVDMCSSLGHMCAWVWKPFCGHMFFLLGAHALSCEAPIRHALLLWVHAQQCSCRISVWGISLDKLLNFSKQLNNALPLAAVKSCSRNLVSTWCCQCIYMLAVWLYSGILLHLICLIRVWTSAMTYWPSLWSVSTHTHPFFELFLYYWILSFFLKFYYKCFADKCIENITSQSVPYLFIFLNSTILREEIFFLDGFDSESPI